MSKNEGNQKLEFFKPSDLLWNTPILYNNLSSLPTQISNVSTTKEKLIWKNKENENHRQIENGCFHFQSNINISHKNLIIFLTELNLY